MVIDCCTILNELELWRLRFEELREVVDRFVVVEALHTHSGLPKEPAFTPPLPTDVPVTVWRIALPDPGVVSIPATRRREMTQRNAIADALRSLDVPDDAIILISDVDEIPRAEVVRAIRDQGVPDGHILTFQQRLYYYSLHTPEAGGPRWLGTRAARWADVRALTPHVVRYGLSAGDRHYPLYAVLPDAGWHFSYFGGVEQVQVKLRSFLHQELVTDMTLDGDRIARRIAESRDLYDRRNGHTFERRAPLLAELPGPIRRDPAAWAWMFGESVEVQR